MKTTTRKLALAATAMATTAMLGITGSGAAHAGTYTEPEQCAGMKAPSNDGVANLAPTATKDTAQAVAGGTALIKVLANDSDPDGDRLAVVHVSTPTKGETCIDSDGTVEYFAVASSAGYTESFTYGLTDGDYYRTGKVTVTVQGVKSMRAQLLHRLVKRGGHVKHAARVGFTNPNHRAMLVIAGNPKRDNPAIARGLGVGRSLALNYRNKKLVFIIGVSTGNGEVALVNFGSLNTVNGRQQIESIADFEDESSGSGSSSGASVGRTWANDRAMAEHWLRIAARH